MTTQSIAATCALITILLAPESGEGEGGNSKIAFSNHYDSPADIFVVNSDGTGLVNLTNSPARETNPVWSPDGGAIAFVNDAGGFGISPDICVMDADGSNVINLTNDGAIDSSPSWSPDGTKISFHSMRDHGWSDIFVMNKDGSDVINLTPGHGHGGNSPAWSPKSEWIAFTGFGRVQDIWVQDIFVIASDGSDVRNLTNSNAADGKPSWSPDGNLIAFNSTRIGDCSNLFIMNADGSHVRQLTTECVGYAPSWYPDGSQIIFELDHDNLQIIDVDGTNQRPLPADGPTLGHRPVWSPIRAVTAVFDLTWGSVKFNQMQR